MLLNNDPFDNQRDRNRLDAVIAMSPETVLPFPQGAPR